MGNQARKQLHTMAALAEGQSRHSGGASEDWGRRGGTGGGPAPTDIEGPAGGVMSRQRCGRNTTSDGRDLRFAGLVQHAGPHHSTAPMEQGERCRSSARLDRVEGGDSRRNGPTRTTNQDLPL